MEKTMTRLRVNAADAHYGGQLVDGAWILKLFGDLATELLIRYDGDEGLFAGYENIEFLAPVYSGEYIEASARIIQTGKTSRKMEFEALKIISPRTDISDSAADLLDSPIRVCYAVGTCVTPVEKQRSSRSPM